jgi:phage shock protein PspC (stress-responsive transcriptional regulator)
MTDEWNAATTGSGGPDDSGGPGRPAGPGRRLERKLNGRWIAGVCAGVADYFAADVNLVRVIFAVLIFVGGLGPVAYVLAWALMPEEGEQESIAERVINKPGPSG